MSAERRYRVTWEGSFSVCDPDGRPVPFPTSKTASLAALLIFRAPDALSREQLASEFWPESEPKRARMSLRTALAAIRRGLGPEVMDSTTDTVRFRAEAFLRPDVFESETFAPEFKEDWAEAVRGRSGIASTPPLPQPTPPVAGLLPAIDYLLEVDPGQAVAFACASRLLLVHAPISEVMPRLEKLRRLTKQESAETLELRVFLATRYLARAQFEPAIEVLKGVVPAAEKRKLAEIAETAAYHLFAASVLLDRPSRALPYLKWLSANGRPTVARMAEGMWSFQYELGEATAARLRQAVEAARVQGNPYFEQTALACLIAVDPTAATATVVERLRELNPQSGLGIGVFAAAFASARRAFREGNSSSAIQRMVRTFLDLRERGDNRIALGALHYTSLLLSEAGLHVLASETYGAVQQWAGEQGISLLASEKRDRVQLRSRLTYRLGEDEFEKHSRRGQRSWARGEFHIP